MRVLTRMAVSAGIAATTLLTAGSPALAADADIDEVVVRGGSAEVLVTLPDLSEGETPDLSSVAVTAGGEEQSVEATLASDDASIQRAAVLVMDTSDSMAGKRFVAAQAAALAFLEQAPDDVRIGLVTFAGEVTTVSEPSTDRAELRTAIEGLEVSRFTRLYEGIEVGLDALPEASQGSLILLSDGADTSGDPARDVVGAIEDSGVRVDVVALGQSGEAFDLLAGFADAGGGQITNTEDPQALERLFEEQAQLLDSQLLVRFDPVTAAGDVDLEVSVDAGGETWTDSALVRLSAASDEPEQEGTDSGPLPTEEAGFTVTKQMMIGGLGALALGCALLVALMTGVFNGRKKETVEDRLKPYGPDAIHSGTAPGADDGGVVTKAVDATEKLIKGGGLDVKLAAKLDAAGMSLHAAEWLLLHAGIAVGAAAVAFALGGGLFAVMGFIAGALLPRFYLTRKESKRIKAFNGQLADTLQLVSGSLSAGLSLTQSLDTVVKEGNEPMAGEFRRALVEQRLGVEVETALDGVAQRMQSKDFAWVVMAIRIQREVGGNLAELLLTVAATLREREYLRRQVKTLSAEGRMSAWILGGLPPGFFAYLLLVNPEYLQPMLAATLGWLMLGAAAVMMVLGVVLLKQMVKVEV